jgi:PEP-CTERM motif-containing protein
MKKVLAVAISVLMLAGVASAAPALSYVVSGDDVVVTAADGATQYWSMTVETTGTKPGRIRTFYDLSGSSNSDFNYADRYISMGLFDPTDGAYIATADRWTISSIVQGAPAMTFTLSRDLTQATTGGTATYSMEYTISAPVAVASGYTTNITSENTWAYDALWDGGFGDGVAKARMRLWVSAEDGSGNEYATAAYNGFAATPATNYQTATATVTGGNADMAVGSVFEITNTWVTAEGYFDAATCEYTAYFGGESPHVAGSLDIGITGIIAGNAGDPGSARSFTSTSELDISIVPEPATMGLLGLGFFGLVVRRRKKK